MPGGGSPASASALCFAMFATRPLTLLAALLAIHLVAEAHAAPQEVVRTRRQLADDNTLQPLDDENGDEQAREKRKLEGITQAKFGIKNAVLGFVFGRGATWNLPALGTALTNTPLTPTAPSSDWSNRLSNPLSSQDLRKSSHTQHIPTSASAIRDSPTPLGTRDSRLPPGIRSIQKATAIPTSASTQGRRALRVGARRDVRQVTKPASDIPVFDRNKVSLEFPGNLFGPSVSLLIASTKIIGSVIQNSAVRYQSFLRLFRPLFRGQFEIKGLDPPTTTTTTTTTTTIAPVSDNEVRR